MLPYKNKSNVSVIPSPGITIFTIYALNSIKIMMSSIDNSNINPQSILNYDKLTATSI